MSPRVSVVMGVHNGARHLRGTLDSLLCQRWGDFELIVVDDGSTDATAEILASCADPRVVTIRQENRGLTRSLNRGIARARGAYVARQDSGDVSAPERLQRQVAFLDAHPEIGLVGTAYRVVAEDGGALATITFPCDDASIRAALPAGNCFCHGTVMFRRSCFDAGGGYREVFRAAQDYDLWLRLAERTGLANLPDALYEYRLAADSITYTRVLLQHRLAELARQLAEARAAGRGEEHLLAGLESLLCAPVGAAEGRRIVASYRYWGTLLLEHGRRREAYAMMAQVVGCHPSRAARWLYRLGRACHSGRALRRALAHA